MALFITDGKAPADIPTAPVTIPDGGTGATTAPAALSNLGGISTSDHAAINHSGLPGVPIIAQDSGGSPIAGGPFDTVKESTNITLADGGGGVLTLAASGGVILPPTPEVFNAGIRASVGAGGSVAISATPLSVPASTFTSFMVLIYGCTFEANHGSGGPHNLIAEVTLNGSTLTALGARNPQEGPSSYSVSFFVSGIRTGGVFIWHGGNGFVPGVLTTCDWGLFRNFDGGSGTMRLRDCYMAAFGD